VSDLKKKQDDGILPHFKHIKRA